MTTQILSAEDARTIARAVELLDAGEAVALPTETVYGLAADALKNEAVLKIFEAKERPKFDPLIVHLPAPDWLDRLTIIPHADEALFDRLTNAFWPGPLTLILPRKPVVPDLVTAGLETVAVRMSAHRVFREIVEKFGRPLAAPSANRFGRISPTQASHVASELTGRIPLIVDSGATDHGLESTIIALRNERIEILREGPIPAEALGEFAEVRTAGPSTRVEAPGQLKTHYAPRTRLILVDDFSGFRVPSGRVGLLGFTQCSTTSFAESRILSESGNLSEAAANLFRGLRELDEAKLDLIVAETVPEIGLGRAIMDRLRRAAAVSD